MCDAEVSLAWENVRIFEQLLCFRVIFPFDLLIIQKVLLHTFMIIKLESISVEGIVEVVSADVMNSDGERDGRLVERLWFANDSRRWRRTILTLFEEIQSCLNMVRLFVDGDGLLLGQDRAMATGNLDCGRCHILLMLGSQDVSPSLQLRARDQFCCEVFLLLYLRFLAG